jgi:RNA polymerase sigma factor (sigma-70 family)
MMPSHSASDERERLPSRRPLVLVVEDTRDHRELYAAELQRAGFAVVEAADGEAAIDTAFESRPQAVVLDLMLPGVSGFNVARLLRTSMRTRDTMIVAVTALTSDASRAQALGAGCDSFLRKPVIGATVVAEVVRLLAKRRDPPDSLPPERQPAADALSFRGSYGEAAKKRGPKESTGDADLLRRWSNGDAAAGSELFTKHFAAVQRFFRRMDRSDADDLVQQTFLGCIESARQFREEASVRTFLLAIARNQLYARHRAVTRDTSIFLASEVLSEVLDDVVESPPESQTRLDRQETIVRHAVTQLPRRLRTVLELYYWDNLAQTEIAASIGAPVGTIASRLRRGKEMVRDLLGLLDGNGNSDEGVGPHMPTWLPNRKIDVDG